MYDTHGNHIAIHEGREPSRVPPFQPRRPREGRYGWLAGLSVMTSEEVAIILYERGVLKKPCRKLVQRYEKRALRKIREAFPELAVEVEK